MPVSGLLYLPEGLSNQFNSNHLVIGERKETSRVTHFRLPKTKVFLPVGVCI
jgi:hypothetical protein